jgi:hypothetical protein
MQCPICDTMNPITEGGFPDRCITCGAWFSTKDQIKEWQIALDREIRCIRNKAVRSDHDHNCAINLEAIYHEMDVFIQILLMKE